MYDGILNVYKEKGYTSHDVVAKLRGILGQKRIGHTGTLDPDAQGVLPVCLGKATRLCDMLTDKTKIYRAVVLLGKETDTQDLSGQVLQEKDVEATREEAVRAVLSFVGEYDQIPPMYSALKVNGKKLYELARQGKVVEREARKVVIHEIVIESVELPRITMSVHCSKGTYIRTLCHDIGRKLGCGGCMESLVRTRSGQFCLEESLTLSQIERLCDQGGLTQRITSIEDMFQGCPVLSTRPDSDRLVHNGNPLKAQELDLGEGEDIRKGSGEYLHYRVRDSKGRFMGIYEWEQERARLKPWKMFLEG
ncbi:MAG: tRNA pseudouridine(55) synthase TruB [Hungatella sp.]|nr:tRNA pseudouridine(55) synthase TruB [Hungatella sp.]